MKYANECMPPSLRAARMIIKIVFHHQMPSNPCDLLPVTSLNQEDPCDPELGQILPKDNVDFLSQTGETGTTTILNASSTPEKGFHVLI